MIREILLPLDTSSLAEAAVPHVIALARAFGSQVHLLSVVEGPEPVSPVDSVDWRLNRSEHEAYLEQVAADLRRQRVVVESEMVVAGNPAEQILEIAGSLDIDLVVMTTHGRGGMTAFRLSGTVSKVLFGAKTSVLLVRPRNTIQPVSVEKILVPVDCSPRADWAVCLGAQIACARGAVLVVVFIAEPPPFVPCLQLRKKQARLAQRLATLNREAAERHLEDLAQQMQSENLRMVTRVIEDADAEAALLRVAEEEDCSLVVLSAHGYSQSPRASYGSFARGLLEHCDRPVLVFQDVRAAGGKGADAEPAPAGPQVVT